MPIDILPRRYLNRKNTSKVVYAMKFGESSTEAMACYKWVEENTAGSFDVNSPLDPIPSSGVSIDAATGHMVIATDDGIRHVSNGDYIYRGSDGKFKVSNPIDFFDIYKPAHERTQ